MSGDSIDFEADSAVAIGDLLGAESDAWCKRQCVDKDWSKHICPKNIRGNASKVRLRFIKKGAAWQGRASFSILVSPLSSADSMLQHLTLVVCQKQKLDAEVELEECEVESVSACREGSEGEPEFLVHWAGGVEKWQAEATTWQSLDPATVLAVWEKQSERESIMQGLQSASLIERSSLQARLVALPQQGSSGVVGSWIEGTIRGHKSKCKILEFQAPSSFKVEFEQWKVGESDPDDGQYDLLNAEFDWNFTDAPPRQLEGCSAVSERGRVARRTRQ